MPRARWSWHNYQRPWTWGSHGWRKWWGDPVEWKEQAFWSTVEEEQIEDTTKEQGHAFLSTVEDPSKEQQPREDAVTPENEKVSPGPWQNSRMWRLEGEPGLMEDKVAIVQGQSMVVTPHKWSAQETTPIHRYAITREAGVQRLFLFMMDWPGLALFVERLDEDVISVPDMLMEMPDGEKLADFEVKVVRYQGGEAGQLQAKEIATGARMLHDVANMQCELSCTIAKAPEENEAQLTFNLAAVEVKLVDPELDNEFYPMSLLGVEKPRPIILPGLITRFKLGLMPSKVEKTLKAGNHMVHGLSGDANLTDVVVVGNILRWEDKKPQKELSIDWWTDKVPSEDAEDIRMQLKHEVSRMRRARTEAKVKEAQRALHLRRDALLQKQQPEWQACEKLTTVEEEDLDKNIECEPCLYLTLGQGAVYCWLCNKWLNGPTQWKDHAEGDPHLKNNRRIASLTLQAMAMQYKLPCDMLVSIMERTKTTRKEERVVISAGHRCSVCGAPGGCQSSRKRGRYECNNCHSESLPEELRIKRYSVDVHKFN